MNLYKITVYAQKKKKKKQKTWTQQNAVATVQNLEEK